MEFNKKRMLENQSIKPLVSICVQTYQHAPFIRKCLDGILMQKTNFPFEIILGEDNSTDGTKEICQSYAEKYPNIIHLTIGKREDVIYINGRPTGRFNLMRNLSNCRGKYKAMCEGDDYWINENKLQQQVDYLESNPECALTFHNAKIVNEKDQPAKWSLYRNPDRYDDTYTLKDLLAFGQSIIPTASIVWRSYPDEKLPFWFDKVYAADLALMLLIAKQGSVKYFNGVNSAYRMTSGGASRQHANFHKITSRIYLYASLRNELADPAYYHVIDDVIRRYSFYGSIHTMMKHPMLIFKAIKQKFKGKKYLLGI